jgi:transposase
MAGSGCFVGRCGMAKSSNLLLNQRVEFCERTGRRQISGESFESICAAYGISRATGYEWLRRLRQTGLEGLAARPRVRHRPCVSAALRRWETPLLALRARRPSWGADKLLAALEREHPHARLPSRSAVTRLLSRLGLAAVRKARARRGPTLPRADHIKVEKANDLWTVDFKGWFRTGNGQRCEPLTVRDLFSRFILCIEAVGQCSEAVVGQRMRKLFARYGLPRAIRVSRCSLRAFQGKRPGSDRQGGENPRSAISLRSLRSQTATRSDSCARSAKWRPYLFTFICKSVRHVVSLKSPACGEPAPLARHFQRPAGSSS